MDVQKQRIVNIGNDLLDWIKENKKGRILSRGDIVDYTGLSLSTVDKMLYGLNTVGGRGRYYYMDIAELIAKGNNPWTKTL